MKFASLGRLIAIVLVAHRYGMDDLIYKINFLHYFKFLHYLYPVNWFSKNRQQPLGIRITKFLEALGPFYVKLGQIASTRPDIFPPTILEPLARLRDQVAPFSSTGLELRLKESYGNYQTIFASIEKTPIASASVAQVHRATLKSGESVLLKVLRPSIEKKVAKDLLLFDDIALLLNRYAPSFRRFNMTEILTEFKRVLAEELDLRKEAAHIAFFHTQYPNQETSHVLLPQTYPKLTTKTILVMSELSGIPAANEKQLIASGVDRTHLAKMALDIFFEQIFFFDRFHADLHPGNLMIDVRNPKQPKWVLLDFGIVGNLSDRDKYYIAKNVFAMLNGDFETVAQLHIDSQWLPEGTDIAMFIQDLEDMVSHIYDKKIIDVSIGKLLLMVFSIARRHQINIQPQLLLLQKTSLNLEALARELDPNLDLWRYSRPKLKRWLSNQKSVASTAKRWFSFVESVDTILGTQSLPMLGQQISHMAVSHKKITEKLADIERRQQRYQFFILLLLVLTVVVLYRLG